MSVIVIIFLYQVNKVNLRGYFKNNFFYFSILFYFYILIRSVFSETPILSLESSLFYFRFFLFAIAVWYLIDANKNLIKYFSIFFLITFIIALIDGYYQFIFGINIFGIISPSERMSLLMNDKLMLGGYLSRLFPLLIGLIILNFNNKILNILLFSVLLILTDILVYITGERTALSLLLLSTVFILLLISKYKIVRLLTIILSISIMIIISLTNDDVRKRNIDTTLNQVGIGENSKQIYIFSHIHQSHFISAYKMFIDNPLFGQGPKTFRNLCSEEKFNHDVYSCATHPHNTYMQLLSETGLVGTIIVFSGFMYLIYIILKYIYFFLFFFQERNLNDYQICLIACFLLTLWPVVPTNSFFNNWVSIVYYLPVGFYLHSIYSNKNDKKYDN